MQRLEDEGLFHHIIESCVLGVKKPSPQIYQQALRIMGRDLDFASVVFLDDIGSNVKTARSLGVAHTIKVGINYHTALEELSTIVGINLLKPYPSSHISPGARSKL